jgi:hypothetical protein
MGERFILYQCQVLKRKKLLSGGVIGFINRRTLFPIPSFNFEKEDASSRNQHQIARFDELS